MIRTTILLLILATRVTGQNCFTKPTDLPSDKVLVYLNSFEESTELMTEEFERTNSKDVQQQRKQDVTQYSFNQYGKPIPSNDKYAIAVEEKIVSWINENISKICEEMKGRNFIPVDTETLPKHSLEEYRYIIKYRYILPNGDPLETKMIFYLHDRVENKDLINYEALNIKLFRPFFYYTADKWYPFYGVMKASGAKRVKEEWITCLNNL